MGQCVYLDTGVLIPLLWDRDRDRENHCRSVVRELRGVVRKYEHRTVKIPRIVIGEAISKYIDDVREESTGFSHQPDQTDLVKNLYEVISNLDAELVTIDNGCYGLAQTLNREDSRLNGTDLYIASMAVYDRSATHLIALDSDLIESTAITEIANKRQSRGEREHGLKVQNNY